MTENRNQDDRPGRPAAGRRLVPYQKFIAVGIGVILAVVLVVALRALGPILKPFLIAVFFCILIYPIERLLVRVKVPRLVAYLLIFGVVITAGYFMGKLISYNVRAFSDELPAYEQTIRSHVERPSCRRPSRNWSTFRTRSCMTFGHRLGQCRDLPDCWRMTPRDP